MADTDKFRWARRVSRSTVRRMYESDAAGRLDAEMMDEVHFAVYARVLDMFEVREVQLTGRVRCRSCRAPLEKAYRAGFRRKAFPKVCAACGRETTCGEYYAGYTGKSLLPGSAADLFERYLERFPAAKTPSEKLLLIDWLIHRFHVSQGVARMGVGVNVIRGSDDEVRAMIEGLAGGGAATAGREDAAAYSRAWRDPVRRFKMAHSRAEIQAIASRLDIADRRNLPASEPVPAILALAPELAPLKKSAAERTKIPGRPSI
jgi:hypothetical protein